MLAELQVGSAWLKGQMDQLEIPDRRGSDLVLHPTAGRHLWL
jgi:hypothetical protein